MGLFSHSLTYSKESLTDFILKPLFVENDIRDIITIRTDIQGSEKLDYISTLSKITKAYQQGTSFTASTGVTITQRTISVVKMKAQVEQAGNTFFGWIKEHALAKGVDWDNVEGTIFEQIIADVFMAALKADLQRQVFFGDELKEVGVTGVADEDYKEYDGFWTRIIADFASTTIPAAQRVTMANGAVAQVDTVTLTGTAGTANITVNGVAYLATFATDLTTTAANFVTSHAATIAARELATVVTSSTTTVIFTSGIAGRPQTISAAVNVSGNLAGTVAATTANTLPQDLAADEAETAFKAMINAMPPEMKKLGKQKLKILASSSMVDNYVATLENDGTEAAHMKTIDGVEKMYIRGYEIIERMDWDEHIDDDFTGYYPHRALLTLPENLVFGTDAADADTNAETWYNKDEQQNKFRVQYKAGTQYIHTNYIVAAY